MCVSCGVGLRPASGGTVDTADILFRIAGGCMLLSGGLNVVVSFFWVLGLIWICVGAFWLIPMLVAILYAVAGIVLAATGKKFRILAFAPIFGMMVSAVDFSIMSGMLDVVALILGIIGFSMARPEEEEA